MVREVKTDREVLAEMPKHDRLKAKFDEFLYGVWYAEKTEDGWRRLDPMDVGETYDHRRVR